MIWREMKIAASVLQPWLQLPITKKKEKNVSRINATATLHKKSYFFSKSLKSKKEAGTNFVLLSQSKNMVRQFKKAFLHRPIKFLHFLSPART